MLTLLLILTLALIAGLLMAIERCNIGLAMFFYSVYIVFAIQMGIMLLS